MSENQQKPAFLPQTFIGWVELHIKIIIVCTTLAAIYQYFDVKQENRVKQSMAERKKFNEDEKLQAAYNRLAEVWGARQAVIQQINQLSTANRDEQAKIQAAIVLPIVEKLHLQKDIKNLVDFFDQLQICVQHRICDRAVAEAFFGTYARSFYQLHQPWIIQQRKVIPGYACPLQVFVEGRNAAAQCRNLFTGQALPKHS
ncbi:hypothetical protein QUF61_11600 [Candidatus Venteria ishoeyi]|uniref:DUF4760 domain-containing protein n=1 Tax=Candidatus Venteria ishoeyi TaxID=1899563 RepID=UPI0025A55063|nr:hypothetical protein [Candidatus Venteria ishoeyi]MDM8547129.1 hypothetical protein [Candidatus Venteria ishoeyi]